MLDVFNSSRLVL